MFSRAARTATGATTSLLALVAALLPATAARAFSDDVVSFTNPDAKTGTQVLTVTLSKGEPGEYDYVTYRVADPDNPPDPGSACPASMADNHDPLFLGPVVSTGTVTRTATVTLNLYLVCSYYSQPGDASLAGAALSGTTVAGVWVVKPKPTPKPPATKQRTTVSLALTMSGHVGTVRGHTKGTLTGKVAMQRLVGKRWVTVKTFAVHKGAYHGSLTVTAHESLRAALAGGPGWVASHSATVHLP